MRQVGDYLLPDADHALAYEYFRGGVNVDVLRECLPLIEGRGVAVDVGAHAGSWTRALAAEFEKVIAFEPQSDNYKCLYENTKGLENLTTVQAALWSKPLQRVALVQRSEHNTGTYQVVPGGKDAMTMKLDQFGQNGKIDFIKVDVEGAELEVLKGAKKVIGRDKPAILYEWTERTAARYGTSKADIERFLTELGYRETRAFREDFLWQA